ncbi:MAG TPA: autotransporter outer membrane beta-barrel domain-containing protein [Candidatus Aphodousia faecigallinarum]|uniref:Autotransporter outer membrane beta-barrel domain-containing protein n=1 Tax=Candidatus Aphodousia faecigallinarum TaxID=2840677 RepID=A0A9D1IHJ5_9BURK|nr:autotransporter outer membrane beta-barrel domain-containing protein [Candidatus Aphodousia faecigallinarum]
MIKPENGVIEGDCKPDENPQHYDTPLTVSYSKLFAYIDENVTIKDDAATIFLESNVEHDAKLSLNGLNANTSLTLISNGEDSPSLNKSRLAFANVYLYGTEKHSAEFSVNNLNLNLIMEDVVGNKNGDFSFGGGAISNGLNTDKTSGNSESIVSFKNSNISIDLDIGKYTGKGFAAGILLSGYERYNTGKTILEIEDSTLNISSSLQGIFLQNTNLKISGNSNLLIRAGKGLGDNAINLSSAKSHEGSGLYLAASLSSNFVSYAEVMDCVIDANEVEISGLNGIDIVRYNDGDFVTAAPIQLTLDNKSSKITAIDSAGHFQYTYALNAEVEEDKGSNIKLAGLTRFTNQQNASPDIDENFYNDTNIYGINLKHFDLTTQDTSKAKTSVNILVSSQGLTKTPHVYGINAEESVLTFNHPLTISASGQTNGTTEAIHLNNSSFTANSTLQIQSIKEDGSLGTALDITDSSATISSENATDSTVSAIVGNIETKGNKFSVDRSDPFVIFGAITSEGNSTQSDLMLSNSQSKWVVTDNSVINKLSLNDAMLSMDIGKHYKSLDKLAFHQLDVNELSLRDATLQFKVDLASDASLSDSIHAASVSGNGVVDINIVGDVTDHKAMSDGVGFLYQDSGELTLQLADKNGDGKPDQVIYQNGSILGWKLAYKSTESEEASGESLLDDSAEVDFSDVSVNGSGKGYWYLTTGAQAEIPDPEPDEPIDPVEPEEPESPDEPNHGGDTPLPPEVAQILSLGSSSAQAISWLAEKEDLRHRLGEIRHGVSDGAWVKIFDKQSRVSDGYGFKQESNGIHLGLDRIISKTVEGRWLVGAALRYAEADQEGLLEGNGSNGELKEYSAKLYATYMNYGGTYVDMVTQFGYYDQAIKAHANDYLTPMGASYDTFGYGVSAEAGHHFKIGESNSSYWFVEPSAELSYFYVEGKKFKTSTDIEVAQEDADFLTARAGVAVGHTTYYGINNQNYVQLALDAGMYYELLGDQNIEFTDAGNNSMKAKATDIGGMTYYYGATLNWKANDKLRFYGNIGREKAAHYKEDYSISVGLKYAF